MTPPPDISVIIVNYNVFDDTCVAINSIKDNAVGLNIEFIVVDNNSPTRDVEKISSIFPDVKFIQLERNTGFAYANNRAMEIAQGKYFLLLNPDIVITDDSVNRLFEYIENEPGVGVVGPVQINPDKGYERYYSFFPTFYSRLMQETGFYVKAPGMKDKFTLFWDENISSGKPFEVQWIIGSFMLLRREIYEATGGFDEAFFLFEEEVEWEQRIASLGYKRIIVPSAKVLHNHHSSISKLGNNYRRYHEFRSRIIYSKKHDGFPINIFRNIIILLGLSMRLLRGMIAKDYRVMGDAGIHKKLYLGLIKMVFSGKKKVLENRFYPEKLFVK